MEASESMQITLQISKYVMHADITFQNDSCFMSLVASAPNILLVPSCYKYIATREWPLE